VVGVYTIFGGGGGLSRGGKAKWIYETHLYILGRAEPRLLLVEFFPSGVFKKSCPMVAAADFRLSTSR
jgi:hypothetical protein